MNKLCLAAVLLGIGNGLAYAGPRYDRPSPAAAPSAAAPPRVASSMGTIRLEEPNAVRIFQEQPRSAMRSPSDFDPIRKMFDYSWSNPLMGGGG